MKLSIKNTDASSAVKRIQKKLESYRARLEKVAHGGGYGEQEGSMNLCVDVRLHEALAESAKKYRSKDLALVVVIGIGGSNLGTQAIYDVVRRNKAMKTEMLFVDTCDPELLREYAGRLARDIATPTQLCVIIVSKSGTTTESLVNAEILLKPLKEKFTHIFERVALITDQGSPLWKCGESLGIDRYEIPKMVGGRFSVFSAVGLLPLMIAGLDCSALLSGAAAMRTQCIKKGMRNVGLVSASVLADWMQRDGIIIDTFLFHPELESLGKWYRQLFAESVGKEKNMRTRVGALPTVTIGSTDLHSMGQLYLAGPRNRLTLFVTTTQKGRDVRIPRGPFTDLIDGVSGKSAGDVMMAIYRGVTKTYRIQKLPFMESLLDDLSPSSIGAWMQWKMIETMYVGHALGVNAFDQPHVELYKKEVRRILNSNA